MWMYFLLSWKILLLKFRYPGVQHFNELQPPPPPPGGGGKWRSSRSVRAEEQ